MDIAIDPGPSNTGIAFCDTVGQTHTEYLNLRPYLTVDAKFEQITNALKLHFFKGDHFVIIEDFQIRSGAGSSYADQCLLLIRLLREYLTREAIPYLVVSERSWRPAFANLALCETRIEAVDGENKPVSWVRTFSDSIANDHARDALKMLMAYYWNQEPDKIALIKKTLETRKPESKIDMKAILDKFKGG